MSPLKFAKIYMFRCIKLSVLIIFVSFFSKNILLSEDKVPKIDLLAGNQTNLNEDNLASEIYITTREKSPLLINNTRPIKQQFETKVSISIGGENGNLFYAKEINQNSNLWLIDWIKLPDFKIPLGGKNKDSNRYEAILNIENSFGKTQIIKLFIDVVKIDEEIKSESEYSKIRVIEASKKNSQDNSNPFKTKKDKLDKYLLESEDNVLTTEQSPFVSTLKIITKEHSPLHTENELAIKQEFNDKVSISISGPDGDLFYAKEIEEESNLWLIDWINFPDYEKPLGGIKNNSNNYNALINISDSSNNVETIELQIDVTDIDETEISGEPVLVNSTTSKKSKKLFSLNNLVLGIAEKGGYLGFIKDIGKKNQLELGYNYLNIDISRFFTTNSDVRIKNSSFKFALRRFLTKNPNKTGFYIEGNGDLSKLNIYSDYSLTNNDSSFGTLSVSCSACGSLYVNLEDRYNFIPSLLVGHRRKINKRLFLDLKAGIQYINIPKFYWKAIQQDGSSYYPPFIYNRIEEEANDEINILNKKIKDVPKFLPTVGLNLIYKF